jgi:hypothetical protein
VTGFILALIHRWNLPQFLYNWQNLIAGGLALVAGLITVWVINKQIKTTVRLEQDRIASEASAFHAMLKAAMERFQAEAAWARQVSPHFFSEEESGPSSIETHVVRQCITKGAFAELRAACVRHGGPLTGDFLDLEREIDTFAQQYEPRPYAAPMGEKRVSFRDRFISIETKAAELGQKAAERIVPHCQLAAIRRPWWRRIG